MSNLRTLVRACLFLFVALAPGFAATAAPFLTPRAERIQRAEVPPEARATLAYVRAHGEAPAGHVGGRRFGNYGRNGEEKLPPRDVRGRRIEYREWDIHPKLPGRNRGAERLVTGSDGRAWYTANHYATFTEIR